MKRDAALRRAEHLERLVSEAKLHARGGGVRDSKQRETLDKLQTLLQQYQQLVDTSKLEVKQAKGTNQLRDSDILPISISHAYTRYKAFELNLNELRDCAKAVEQTIAAREQQIERLEREQKRAEDALAAQTELRKAAEEREQKIMDALPKDEKENLALRVQLADLPVPKPRESKAVANAAAPVPAKRPAAPAKRVAAAEGKRKATGCRCDSTFCAGKTCGCKIKSKACSEACRPCRAGSECKNTFNQPAAPADDDEEPSYDSDDDKVAPAFPVGI